MDETEKLLSITLKRQIGTCVFFFDFTYQASNSKFNHVCSEKDPDHADSNPDP
jgi:hypothetical protein